jgi:hypothetical protein
MSQFTFQLNNDDELVTIIRYDAEELVFSTHYIGTVSKKTITSDDIYLPVNRYLQTCWKDYKDNLFASYKRLHYIMDTVNDYMVAYGRCQKEIVNLFNILTYNSLRSWVGEGTANDNVSGLITPDNLVSDQYNETSSDTTFKQKEYRDLLVLSMVSRFMIPVWAHFINRYTEGMLEDFKESTVFNLLQPTWVQSCEIMEFVLNYIRVSINATMNSNRKEGKVDMRSINIGGISEHNLPMYLVAMTMLRRVGCMNLYGSGQANSNLVNVLYSYAISNLLTQLPQKLSGRIMLKRQLDPSSDSQSRGSSIIDKCRISQNNHVGIHVVHGFYAEKFISKIGEDMCALINGCTYAEVVKPDLTTVMRMLPRCVDIATECNLLITENITDSEAVEAYGQFEKYRRYIVAIWIGNVFNHAEIRLLDAKAFANLAGLLTAILIEMGHIDLAIILNSRPILSDESISIDGSPIDSRHCDALIELYPNHEQFSEKEKSRSNFINKINNARRDKNQIVKSIEGLTALIPYRIWSSSIKLDDLVTWGIDPDKDVIGKLTNRGIYTSPLNRKLLLVTSIMDIGKINQ